MQDISFQMNVGGIGALRLGPGCCHIYPKGHCLNSNPQTKRQLSRGFFCPVFSRRSQAVPSAQNSRHCNQKKKKAVLQGGSTPIQGHPHWVSEGGASAEESHACPWKDLTSKQFHNLRAFLHTYQVNGAPGISSHASKKKKNSEPSVLFATRETTWPLSHATLANLGAHQGLERAEETPEALIMCRYKNV